MKCPAASIWLGWRNAFRVVWAAAGLYACGQGRGWAAADDGGDPERFSKVTVVWRYDDYNGKSDLASFEQSLLTMFQLNNVPLTIGVIPRVCSGDVHDPTPQALVGFGEPRAEPIRRMEKAGLCEVAQHGYSHQTRRLAPPHTEFIGLPLDTQVDLIRRGRQQLEGDFGSNIVTFIPPWNSFDENTVRAAGGAGLRCFSAGSESCSLPPASLRFIPATCSLAQLERAVREASRSKGRALVVVLFHGYDFRETGATTGYMTLPGLEKLLKSIRRKGVAFSTLGRCGIEFPYLDVKYIEELSRMQLAGVQPFLPRRFRQEPLFLPAKPGLADVSRRIATRVVGGLLLLYGGAVIGGAVLSGLVMRISRGAAVVMLVVTLCGLGGLTWCAYRVWTLGSDRAYLIALPFAFTLPWLWRICRPGPGLAEAGLRPSGTSQAV